MTEQKRMPRYEVRNDGTGPYAVFYCEKCERAYRSQPDPIPTIAQGIGKQAMGGLLRNIPLVGNAVANNMSERDPRYIHDLTPQQLQAAWAQVEKNFHLCPTCGMMACNSCFDVQSGFCLDDTPRKQEMAEAKAEQAAGVLTGLASAFGLKDAFRGIGQTIQSATANMARCPNDGTMANPGTKFCPNCGAQMIQPAADTCPKCGAQVGQANFCPSCGTKIERAPAAPPKCPNCGADVAGVKFCPGCGTKVG